MKQNAIKDKMNMFAKFLKTRKVTHRILVFLILAGLASSCSLPLTTLPNGERSFMAPEANSLRSALKIDQQLSPLNIEYHPVEPIRYRSYSETFKIYNKNPNKESVVKVKAVGDKFTIIIQNPGEVVDVLVVEKNGKLYDYNKGSLTDICHQQHVIPETAKKCSAPLSNNWQKQYVKNPKMLSSNEFLFPEYLRPLSRSGQVVGVVRTFAGDEWGQIVYSGITDYNGRRAAVLDLMRRPTHLGYPYLVGFNVVDLETSLPLVAVISSGYYFKMWRVF